MQSLDKVQLRLLRLMREATMAGVIKWAVSESDDDLYCIKSGPVESYIHFKWPAYCGDVGSDRDFVEVGGVGRFMIGTQGWTLALEILATASKDWKTHITQLRARCQRKVRLLTSAMRKTNRKVRRRKV